MPVNLEPVVQFTIAVTSERGECVGNVVGDGLLGERVGGRPNKVADGLRRADNSLVLDVDDLSSGVGALWSDRRVERAEMVVHCGGDFESAVR